MPRWEYVTGGWYSDREMHTTCDVYEPEAGPVKTGLLDSGGAPLFRIPRRQTIGFVMEPSMAKRKGSKRC